MEKTLKVVHYLNQMFGGIGGEDMAHVGVSELAGPKGPGVLVDELLSGKGSVVATVVCGDNYIVENTQSAIKEIVELIKKHEPDFVVAGPAYNAGRYGVACGEVCKAVKAELKIPVVTAMYDENPGVEMFRRDVHIVKTRDSAASARKNITSMVELALKLVAGQAIGKPDEEGYFPQGIVKDERVAKNAAARAADMLLAKLKGQPYESEVSASDFPPVKPAPAVADLKQATVAIVTDGGLIPKPNPDRMEARLANSYGAYSMEGMERISAEGFRGHHVGYDNSLVNEDPNRLVPLDVLRDLEREGVIGKVYDKYYTCAGVAAPMANGVRVGKGIAKELKMAGVHAVILTST